METSVFVAEDLLKRLQPNMQVQRNQPFVGHLTSTATWWRPRRSKSMRGGTRIIQPAYGRPLSRFRFGRSTELKGKRASSAWTNRVQTLLNASDCVANQLFFHLKWPIKWRMRVDTPEKVLTQVDRRHSSGMALSTRPPEITPGPATGFVALRSYIVAVV
jgi:hypothetical protein